MSVTTGCVAIFFCFVGFFGRDSHQQNDVLPAVPLVVKSPYLSTWLPARELNGVWPVFWNGHIKGMGGLVKVNGVTYEFMGDPQKNVNDNGQHCENARQTSLSVTPTQSIFKFQAGPIELTVNFFTPIDPTDLKRHSLPASYVAMSARSTDGGNHQVQLYMDITGEWATGDLADTARWSFNSVGNDIANLDMTIQNPRVLHEMNENDGGGGGEALWGTIKYFTDASATHEANDCAQMRVEFARNGRLRNSVDNAFRRIDDRWPGLGFAREITAGPQQSPNVFFGIAYVRRPAVSYTVGEFNQLWESYFNGDANQMVGFFFGDRNDALRRAQDLDNRVLADARKEGGDSYAKVVSAAVRQAYGGTELVGTPDKPWLMLKEISSDGNCQTVDLIYPHFPIQLYFNPKLLRYLLDPLIDNQERGFFPRKYAMHDIGARYPRCVGHTDGNEEAMEVEESANMVIMMAAYVRASGDKDWASRHYNIAKQWTQYLVDRGLITNNALTTDDFLGPVKNSTNLAIKAIIGIGAMSQLAEAVGNQNDKTQFRQTAERYVQEWIRLGEDPSHRHMKDSYNDPNTWFLIYNMYADKLLDTKLVPDRIYQMQDQWYLSSSLKYGIPLRSGIGTSKFDWLMFTAASSSSQQLRQTLYDKTAQWLRETPTRAPFTDYADMNTGGSPMFVNRPVIGAVFAPLTIKR